MDQEIVLLGILGLLTLLGVVLIWQAFATARARAKLAREDEYRGLSARAIAVQEDSGRRLDEITREIVELRARLDKIERVLTVVD
ncbi:hypothetical protein ABNF97_08865 [Plantactinospora sp. B6F1]|uniref:hypothetical protein n=1 Tax=Plantactinospora sp. B6F1 TaxID=3158971 RepID=UPI00102BBE44